MQAISGSNQVEPFPWRPVQEVLYRHLQGRLTAKARVNVKVGGKLGHYVRGCGQLVRSFGLSNAEPAREAGMISNSRFCGYKKYEKNSGTTRQQLR